MIVAIIQAHLASTRLPRKITRLILDQPMLAWVVHRAQRIPEVSRVVVAASNNPLDQWVTDWCRSGGGVECYRGGGEERDVLTRYEETAKALELQGTDRIVRITADCPVLDPAVSSRVIQLHRESQVDYASNLRDWPDGLDTEVFTRTALQAAYHLTGNEADREHVTPWMRRNLFCVELPHEPNLRHVKVSVDTEEELEYVREVYEALGPDFGWEEVLGVQPGRVCPSCAAGYPHRRYPLGSIMQKSPEQPMVTVWDLHAHRDGTGLLDPDPECRAPELARRAAGDGTPPWTICAQSLGAAIPRSPGACRSSRPDGGDR